MASAWLKRSRLEAAWEAAQASEPPTAIRTWLRAQETALAATLDTGQTIQSTSGNGRQVVFAEPGSAGPTPLEMVELWRELIDLHDRVQADLGESPTDDEIYAGMMAEVRPVKSLRSDHTLLRC
ncbi:MAG TPA: hypothetical protein PKW32_03455 [Verrucomicrobiota bacterium]|nr:hypothetical protein [Verrucomicrobiota bacterium]